MVQILSSLKTCPYHPMVFLLTVYFILYTQGSTMSTSIEVTWRKWALKLRGITNSSTIFGLIYKKRQWVVEKGERDREKKTREEKVLDQWVHIHKFSSYQFRLNPLSTLLRKYSIVSINECCNGRQSNEFIHPPVSICFSPPKQQIFLFCPSVNPDCDLLLNHEPPPHSVEMYSVSLTCKSTLFMQIPGHNMSHFYVFLPFPVNSRSIRIWKGWAFNDSRHEANTYGSSSKSPIYCGGIELIPISSLCFHTNTQAHKPRLIYSRLGQ